MYGGAAGGGKIVYEYQHLLTPNGWKSIVDVVVGDTICDPHGNTQVVKHLFAWEGQEVYQVEFDDGTVFDTAAEHQWTYWISRDGKVKSKTRSTKEMWEDAQTRGKTAIIPTVTTVHFSPEETEVDPYTLGVMLGDGCIVNKSISYTCHEDDWPHYRKEMSFKDTKRSGYTVRMVGKERKSFVDYLEKVGLLGTKSADKFIPKEFLFNSLNVRKEVLRGLMDTDGHRCEGRARAEYTSVSKRLAEGVKFLAQSLGYRVSVYTKTGSYKNELGERVLCQEVYRLYITGEDVDDLFKLDRKKNGILGKQTGRRIVNIKKLDITSRGRCITVSNDDGLYVTDDFIVTHNSYAIVADPMRYFHNKDFQGLLLRRTTDELRELIRVSKQLYPRAFKGAKFVERDKTWYFPSGASMWMSYLERDDDVMRYQGQAFSWIGFDELTQWPTPYAWQYLSSRLRTPAGSNLPLCQRATTNPGGPGHAWVKKMFIDPAEWGTAFYATDLETGKMLRWPENHSDKERAGQPLFKRKFIPAKLSDNPYLSVDGKYEANLLSLPEQQRRQLLEGGWDITEGVAFPEWNRHYHVTEPWDIPDNWPRFRSCDYGYNDPSSVVWFAVAPDNQLVVYREIHVKGVIAEDLAVMIASAEIEADEHVSYGILDSSMWNNMGESGPSRAEKMNLKLREYGLRPFRKADRSKGSRLDRKNEFHRRLKIQEELPGIVFFNNCLSCISTIPVLQLDKHNPEDVDTKADDHDYDAVTYGIMSRPLYREKQYGTRQEWTPASNTFGY